MTLLRIESVLAQRCGVWWVENRARLPRPWRSRERTGRAVDTHESRARDGDRTRSPRVDENVQRHVHRGEPAAHRRRDARKKVDGDRAVRGRRVRQPVGAVRARPDRAARRRHQRQTHVPVALPGRPRRRRAGRHAGRHLGHHLLAAHPHRAVDVPVARTLAVLRPGIRLRGRHNVRRTVAGPHQTVVLPNRTYLHLYT